MRPRRPKRMDAATREATEHAKQYGVCMIPIKLSRLFSGKNYDFLVKCFLLCQNLSGKALMSSHGVQIAIRSIWSY